MDIVTYTIGVLIGLVPVLVDLGPSGAPAELLLDGSRACTVTAAAPQCVLDLGPDPRIHSIELVRRNAEGATSRVVRWINRPGIRAEVHATIDCQPRLRACDFRFHWGHPYKLDPSKIVVTLDGKSTTVSRRTTTARIGFPARTAPRVATVEAFFVDGARAIDTHLLEGSYPESAEASLEVVPLRVAAGPMPADVEARLAAAGCPAHAVERGESEVVFIVTPRAFSAWASHPGEIETARLMNPGQAADRILAIAANESLASESPTAFVGRSSRPGFRKATWFEVLFRAEGVAARRARTADAVAVAGYHLGRSSGRRLAVLVLGSGGEDESAFSPRQALDYLRETSVPLLVWRVGDSAGDGWPDGLRMESPADLVRETRFLSLDLDRQTVAWFDERTDLACVAASLPAGVEIAGRGDTPVAAPAALAPPDAMATPGVGAEVAAETELPGQTVLALAVGSGNGSSLYAGTARGLFVKESDEPWRSVLSGENAAAILSVTVRDREVVAAGSGGIARSRPDGHWEQVSLPATLSVATGARPDEPWIASVAGSLLRSEDGGRSWKAAEKGLDRSFVVCVAADPSRSGAFWAGTSGQGLFRSTDGGKSWSTVTPYLARSLVRAILPRPGTQELFLATDEGVFRSPDGKGWALLRDGMGRTPVYALAFDPRDPSVVFAGGPQGLFRKQGEGAWNRLAPALRNVTSIAIDAVGHLYAGTVSGGVNRVIL